MVSVYLDMSFHADVPSCVNCFSLDISWLTAGVRQVCVQEQSIEYNFKTLTVKSNQFKLAKMNSLI